MRLEIGAGEHPEPAYDLHTDLLPLPGIQVRCRLDRLPFADASITALRANHVLEHQSWQLVEPTLLEWARVLRPGAPVDIGVPDGRRTAAVRPASTTRSACWWELVVRPPAPGQRRNPAGAAGRRPRAPGGGRARRAVDLQRAVQPSPRWWWR